MDRSLESLYSSPTQSGHTLGRECRRPNFFSTITTKVSRSIKRPLRTRGRVEITPRATSQASSDYSRSSSRPRSQQTPVMEATWKRRGQTPDMDDYLSLSQLESVWMYQDSYTGGVETTLTSKSYSFQEIAEAPTIVKHKYDHDRSTNDSLEDLSATENSRPDEAVVVDGVMHPALRPVPYLNDYSKCKSLPQLPKVQISSTG